MVGWLKIGSASFEIPYVACELKNALGTNRQLLFLKVRLGPDGFELVDLPLAGTQEIEHLSHQQFHLTREEEFSESYFWKKDQVYKIRSLTLSFKECTQDELQVEIEADIINEQGLELHAQAQFTTKPSNKEKELAPLEVALQKIRDFSQEQSEDTLYSSYYQFHGRSRRVPGLLRLNIRNNILTGTGIERSGSYTLSGSLTAQGTGKFVKTYNKLTESPADFTILQNQNGRLQGHWQSRGNNMRGTFCYSPNPDPHKLDLITRCVKASQFSEEDLQFWPVWEGEKDSDFIKPSFFDQRILLETREYYIAMEATLGSRTKLITCNHQKYTEEDFLIEYIFFSGNKKFAVKIECGSTNILTEIASHLGLPETELVPIHFKQFIPTHSFQTTYNIYKCWDSFLAFFTKPKPSPFDLT